MSYYLLTARFKKIRASDRVILPSLSASSFWLESCCPLLALSASNASSSLEVTVSMVTGVSCCSDGAGVVASAGGVDSAGVVGVVAGGVVDGVVGGGMEGITIVGGGVGVTVPVTVKEVMSVRY